LRRTTVINVIETTRMIRLFLSNPGFI